MPSKSKAQAHLMAAAAHNPEIAKDTGIPQDVAHDFNQADKKEGTLKKGSDAPEHVTEEVINEASGVGILKVPPTLLKQVQRLVGSVVFTMALMRQHEMMQEGDTDEAQALNTFLKRYQNKYNVSKLSAADLKKYVNSITDMPIDNDAIFNELPDSLKNKPGVKEAISKMRIHLLLSNQVQGISGSSDAPNGRAMNVQTLKIPRYQQFRYVSDIVDILNHVVGTVEHELQHAIQQSALYAINKHVSQLEFKPNYAGDDGKTYGNAYYASGIEFGTQTKDIINYSIAWLDNNPDEITGNKNHDISNAIKYALRTHKGELIDALKNYKHDDRAKKVMKLLYLEVSKFYEKEFFDQSDSGKVDDSEQDVFGDTSDSYYRMLEHPEAGDSLLGDLWLAIEKYFNEKPAVYGNYDDIKRMVFRRPFGEIEFEPEQSGGIHMYIKSETRAESFHIKLDPNETKTMIGRVHYFSNLKTLNDLKHRIEYDKLPNVNLENAYHELEDIKETESMFSSNSNKKISIQFDEEDMNIWVSFKGARHLMYIQEAGKEYYVGYDETHERCSIKDFNPSFEELFKFYYDDKTTDKMINKMLKHITSQTVTPHEIQSYAEYVKDLYKSKEEASIEESSMRGLADIVQNAELENDIDDANDQELINKGILDEDEDSDDQEYDLQGKPVEPGQTSAPVNAGTSTERLSEMPLQYDTFMGMDPQIHVDRKARKSPYKNMTPVKDHGDWTTYRGPDGYMAYDNDTNEALAVVEGFEHHGWFNVDVTASSRNVKGVVYQMFMDIVKVEGTPILSGRIQSDDAIKFWKRLIQSHKVFVVVDDEVLQQATPEKFHKYWSEEEGSPQSQFQFLLVK